MKVAGGYKKLHEVNGGCMMLPAYEKLMFYKDICEIRRYIYKITERFKKSHLRLVSQMRDAARSAKQNIREGYKKGSVGEFRRGIVISLGSLEELSGDVEDCLEDNLITRKEFDELSKLFRSVNYMTYRYLRSLNKIESEGKWKNPYGKKLQEVARQRRTGKRLIEVKQCYGSSATSNSIK